MRNLESIFVAEFRRSFTVTGERDVYKVQLPECAKGWKVSGAEMYGVDGVSEPYFEKLNRKLVKRLTKGYKQRVVDKVNRCYKKDENGNYVYKDYTVPTGSVVVLSDVRIDLPHEKRHTPSKGYGYIDFVDNKGVREYMYVLPKSVLYQVHQTALAISVKNMKNFSGMGYKTWSMGNIFIHVIPYRPNSSYTGTKILKTGTSLDYSKEIMDIVSYWQEVCLIPNISLCQLQDGTNLAVKKTVVGYSDYSPIDSIPISDEEIYGYDSEEEGSVK